MDRVFAAVADPTRRILLERLRSQGPLSVKQLAKTLPMSRQAVTKHLDVLIACGLIEVRRVGRARLHFLDPTPLQEVETWLRPFIDAWDRRLERLEQHPENIS